MFKLIEPSDFDFNEPCTSILPVHSRGVDNQWLKKSAAVLKEELKSIRPEVGKTFMHLIALGDFEKTGANRNGDGFHAKANKEYHNTFVKHANFYRNHKNKPAKGDKIYGNVKHSAYNEEMGRVELIIAIDNEAAPDTIQKVASGQDIPVSMACHVPYDVCSICQNKATKVEDYCNHITKHAGKILDDGRAVYMDNTQPRFFDISEVKRPADRIAYTLRKVASASEPLILSVEKAAMYGMFDTPVASVNMVKYASKLNLLRKLAEMEKHIEGKMKGDKCMQNIADTMKDSVIDEPTDAAKDYMPGVMHKLATMQVSLSLEDFLKLVMGKGFKDVEEHVPEAQSMLPRIFGDLLNDSNSTINDSSFYEPLDIPVPMGIKELIESLPDKVPGDGGGNRLMIMSVRKSGEPAKTIIKKSSVSKEARVLAEEYAKYKLSFLNTVDNPFITNLSVLQNF